ncbi:hypothetical protein JCM19232_2650 [Vibrio ishigakensis]|uniref:Uncharacterized protein n=1 Tax=Vibrio ishigakensis TaxID=1481914 RepID=A0A0B8PA33_9VIBR|nr:hypothetical protein JCM19232_2650 [Vibrio ishigakensis]
MAIPAQAQDMTIRRGDTWASTKFQTFEESISDVWSPGYRPTIEEVYEAISNGQLTPINLRQYEISSDVKVGGLVVISGSYYLTT